MAGFLRPEILWQRVTSRCVRSSPCARKDSSKRSLTGLSLERVQSDSARQDQYVCVCVCVCLSSAVRGRAAKGRPRQRRRSIVAGMMGTGRRRAVRGRRSAGSGNCNRAGLGAWDGVAWSPASMVACGVLRRGGAVGWALRGDGLSEGDAGGRACARPSASREQYRTCPRPSSSARKYFRRSSTPFAAAAASPGLPAARHAVASASAASGCCARGAAATTPVSPTLPSMLGSAEASETFARGVERQDPMARTLTFTRHRGSAGQPLQKLEPLHNRVRRRRRCHSRRCRSRDRGARGFFFAAFRRQLSCRAAGWLPWCPTQRALAAAADEVRAAACAVPPRLKAKEPVDWRANTTIAAAFSAWEGAAALAEEDADTVGWPEWRRVLVGVGAATTRQGVRLTRVSQPSRRVVPIRRTKKSVHRPATTAAAADALGTGLQCHRPVRSPLAIHLNDPLLMCCILICLCSRELSGGHQQQPRAAV
eukprot:352930-Chlamydomonas_euryale.AAC.1